MPTVYRASTGDPVPPVTEQRLGKARLFIDEIVVEHRHYLDRTPLTAIDHLEVSGASVRVVLVSGATTLLTAPNTTAAHTFAAAVAAALTPVEARASIGKTSSSRRPSVWTRQRRPLVIALSIVAYLIVAPALFAVATSVSPDRATALVPGLVMSPIFTPLAILIYLRHWKPVMIRRRRGITVIGERTGSYQRKNMIVHSYSFTTADGQTLIGSEPGVKSEDDRVEVVYDPKDPKNHHVKVDAWGRAIPYVASTAFLLMAAWLPLALIYVFAG